MESKTAKAKRLTDKELQEIMKNGGLASVAQALGLSGRGTPNELLKRIKDAQLKSKESQG